MDYIRSFTGAGVRACVILDQWRGAESKVQTWLIFFYWIPRSYVFICLRGVQQGEFMMAGFDITGLPFYYINKIHSERMDDGTVLVVCGLQRGDDFTPMYAAVSPNEVAMTDGLKYIEAARGIRIAH